MQYLKIDQYRTKFLILVLLFSAALFIAGCTLSPDDLIRANPALNDFLKEYPNSEVKIVRLSTLQIQETLESVREECNNPYLEAKDYYRITIEDTESGLSILAWVNSNDGSLECAVKKAKKEEKPIEEKNAEEGEAGFKEDEKDETDEEENLIKEGKKTPEPVTQPMLCPSCDDSNKCTFDYCNELTGFECEYREVKPCFNNGVCEELETDLALGPSCPNLGWVSPTIAVPVLRETQAQKGYFDYYNEMTSGSNNDCPTTCDDGDTVTSDYFDFKEQKCKSYLCFKDTTPPQITVLEPQENSVVVSNPYMLRFKTNEDSTCKYTLNTPYYEYIDTFANVEYSRPIEDTYLSGYILLICEDKAGNSNKKRVDFKIDLTPPTIESVYPINELVISETRTKLSVTTKIDAICDYKWHVSTLEISEEFGPEQMENTGGTYHSQWLNSLHDNSTYTVYFTCKYLEHTNTVSATFKINSSVEPIYYYVD